MGQGVPIPAKSNSWVVVLLHGVVFWWTRYCIAQTGILYMGPGVPIPAKSNSWVVVFLHGVVFWWTQYCIAQTGILYMGQGVPIAAKSNSWVVVLLHGVVFWWTRYCIAPDRDTLHGATGGPNSSQVQQLGGSVSAWCCILMDSVLYSLRQGYFTWGWVSQF